MKKKIKELFTRPRVIILLIFLVFSLVAIRPSFSNDGVAIRNILPNSTASFAGMVGPNPTATPMSREVIQAIDNQQVRNLADYFNEVSSIRPNTTVTIQTNKDTYFLSVEDPGEELGLVVYDAPTSNVRKGLDLEGGTRVLLQPEEKVEQADLDLLIENMKQRLNVYGLSDLTIREANDLPPPLGSGNQYIVVEIAGATEQEVKDLLAKQGKFEAQIANQTAFTGGDDIRSVCRSADCAGIDPQYGCTPSSSHGSQWVCQFRFAISLSQAAADQQAAITQNLNVITDENNYQYLEEPIRLILDDAEVDQLNIAADLKGRAVTDISITGSGVGISRQEAALDALSNMKNLQTILITGSLPVKINIVKTDTISPLLGEEFIKNSLFVGLLALSSVAIVIFFRYRRIKVSLTMAAIMVTEIVLLLGVASLIGWNLDLAAIAGIIIAVGTGVDHQIVITDETLGGESRSYNWKKKLKRALFIIMAAYITTVVAMIPLVFAGAGLLKGFAITTIIGVSIGVFITRPAYAAIIETLLKE